MTVLQLEEVCEAFFGAHTPQDARDKAHVLLNQLNEDTSRDAFVLLSTALLRSESDATLYFCALQLCKIMLKIWPKLIKSDEERIGLIKRLLPSVVGQSGLAMGSKLAHYLIRLRATIAKLEYTPTRSSSDMMQPAQELFQLETQHRLAPLIAGLEYLTILVEEFEAPIGCFDPTLRTMSLHFAASVMGPVFEQALLFIRLSFESPENSGVLRVLPADSRQQQLLIVRHTALKLCHSVLTYDFTATGRVAQDAHGLPTLVPSNWKFLVQSGTLDLFFQSYARGSESQKVLVLRCLRPLSSVKRTMFQHPSARESFMGRILTFCCSAMADNGEAILRSSELMLHFCSLLATLNAFYSFREFTRQKDFQQSMHNLHGFTTHVLQSEPDQVADGALEGLLDLWAGLSRAALSLPAGLITSMKELREARELLQKYSSSVCHVYMESKLRLAMAVCQPDCALDDPLEEGDMSGTELYWFSAIARMNYSSVCESIVVLLERKFADMKSLASQAPTADSVRQYRVNEGCLCWLVYIISALVKHRLYASLIPGINAVDSKMCQCALELMEWMDQLRTHDSALAKKEDWPRLEKTQQLNVRWAMACVELVYTLHQVVIRDESVEGLLERAHVTGRYPPASRTDDGSRSDNFPVVVHLSKALGLHTSPQDKSSGQAGDNDASDSDSDDGDGRFGVDDSLDHTLATASMMGLGLGHLIYSPSLHYAKVNREEIRHRVAVLELIATRVMHNLTHWSHHKDVIRRTLDLFSSLAGVVSAGRGPMLRGTSSMHDSIDLLMQCKFVKNLVSKECKFPFLSDAAYAKHRTTFYQIMARLMLMADQEQVKKDFPGFMSTITNTCRELTAQVAQVVSGGDDSRAVRDRFVGVIRDLRGVSQAITRPAAFELFHDWLFPDRANMIVQGCTLWLRDANVTNVVLKFVAGLVDNETRGVKRIQFDNMHTGPIVLFRFAAQVIAQFGAHMLESEPVDEDDTEVELDSGVDLYETKYKLVASAAVALTRCLRGSYINWGILKLYQEPGLKVFDIVLRLALGIPTKHHTEYPKLESAVWAFLDSVCVHFPESLLSVDFQQPRLYRLVDRALLLIQQSLLSGGTNIGTRSQDIPMNRALRMALAGMDEMEFQRSKNGVHRLMSFLRDYSPIRVSSSESTLFAPRAYGFDAERLVSLVNAHVTAHQSAYRRLFSAILVSSMDEPVMLFSMARVQFNLVSVFSSHREVFFADALLLCHERYGREHSFVEVQLKELFDVADTIPPTLASHLKQLKHATSTAQIKLVKERVARLRVFCEGYQEFFSRMKHYELGEEDAHTHANTQTQTFDSKAWEGGRAPSADALAGLQTMTVSPSHSQMGAPVQVLRGVPPGVDPGLGAERWR